MTAVVTPVLTVTAEIVSMWEVTPTTIASAKDTSVVAESTLLLGMSPDTTSGGVIPSAAVVSTKPYE